MVACIGGNHPVRQVVAIFVMTLLGVMLAGIGSAAADVEGTTIEHVQRRVVKVFGAGGFRGLEAYQSGLLVSDVGHVLTAYSHVLDTDEVMVLLDDGSRHRAELVQADPRLEAAVLRIDVEGSGFFDLDDAAHVETLSRVLAFSNLFGIATGDEPLSVQHGVVAAYGPLDARRGVFDVSYSGPVYVIDAMTSNPGAAGGAVTDRDGRLVGMIGKAVRNAGNHTLVNYAIPREVLGEFVTRAIRGVGASMEKGFELAPRNRQSLEQLGIVLVPDVVERTPPFVDAVRADSLSANVGLAADDLIVFFNGELVGSCGGLVEMVGAVDQADLVTLTVMRDGELMEFVVRPD